MDQHSLKIYSALETSTKSTDSKPPFVIGIDLGTTNSLMDIAGKIDDTLYLPSLQEDNGSEGSFPHFVPVRLLQLPQMNLDGTIASHVLFPSVVFQASPESPIFAGMGAREAKFLYRRGRHVFYSVKLDLGTDRDPYYPGAVSVDLSTPVKVSAVVLRIMREAAEGLLDYSIKNVPVIVTIPASFQSSQRRDTVLAAQMAGFTVSGNSLFDEPNAALLAYMNRQRVQLRWNQEETVLVFDFGGGTCDISIIDVNFAPVRKSINLRSLAISRFEQLGGDDIDKHLVHSYLKEHFYSVSGLGERKWSLAERQHSIWSQLAKIAELLKIRFCEEIDKVSQFTEWKSQEVKRVRVSIPPQLVKTSQGEILLDRLSLDWEQFNHVMKPFLDLSGAENEDREYYRITSIFTPIQDALEKANLKPKEITRILLVGGSSRNPLVERAIHEYFPDAALERPKDMDYLVAEGAAVHAFTRFVLGHDILSPILGDTIGLLAEDNQFVPLITAGSQIPFPNQTDCITHTQFRVPKDFMSHVDLVFCAGSANRPVHTVKLEFGRVIPRDTAVHLKIRLDGNKIFWMEAFLPEYPNIRVSETIDNPLGLLPMTSFQRERAELEKILASAQAKGTLDQHVPDMERLAEVLNEMDRSEQALGWIDQAIRRRGQTTAQLKRMKAQTHEKLGEHDQAHKIWAELSDQNPGEAYTALNAGINAPDLGTKEKYIRRAVMAAPNDGICQFYLAWVLREKSEFAESRQALDKARKMLELALLYHPQSPTYLSFLAATYDHLNMPEKSAPLWQRYHTLNRGKDTVAIDASNLVGLSRPLMKL